MRILSIWLVVLGTSALLTTGVAQGEVDFKGKTVTIIVTSSPGGGTDRAARIVAEFLPKYLPGNPTMIVQNIPGGGSAVGTNYAYNRAKPNGLTIVQNSSSALNLFLTKRGTVKFDILKFPVIGSIVRGGNLLIVRKDAKDRLTDKNAKPVVVAALEGVRNWNALVVWGAEFLDWNVRWVLGYPGSGDLILALRRGEADMTGSGNAFILQQVIEEGLVEPIAQMGVMKGRKLIPRKSFPDVPTFPDLLGDKRPRGIHWKAYVSWAGTAQVDKWLHLPPNTPNNIIQVYRKAFDEMVKDTGFQQLARKQLSEDYEPIRGEETEKAIRDVVDVPEGAFEYQKKLKKKYGLPLQ